ncbi:MAG: STAS domain-containing protein [Gammaproteobacteria bacterium]|nr:STAS domain-containing protein [Gammaproteobacteria bacterium]
MLTFVDAGSALARSSWPVMSTAAQRGSSSNSSRKPSGLIGPGSWWGLENVELITSAGLRVLLMLAKELKKRSGNIAFYDCQKSVLDVFEMTGFDSDPEHSAESYERAVFAVGSTLDSNGQSAAARQGIH